MSRHGYVDDCDDELAAGRWRGQVASAIRGKRGQKFLRDMRDALYAMPEKRLIKEALVTADGEHCAMGCVGAARGIDMTGIDPEETDRVAATFGIAEVLACEIAYQNDEDYLERTPEQRWEHMRKWVEKRIKAE